jgi:thioredoxin-like negative regulator of GroEL
MGKGGELGMGIFDFFRRRKKPERAMLNTVEPDWKVTLAEDPFEGKIQAALGLKARGKEGEAEILLRQIVEEKHEHVRAWYALAELFIETNAVGRALYCYEQIAEYQPSNGLAREQVGKLQSIVRDRPDYLWEYNKERGII